MIATHSGICPVCCHYIAKTRSDIERLPQRLRPQVEQSDRFYSEHGSWFHSAGNESAFGRGSGRDRSCQTEPPGQAALVRAGDPAMATPDGLQSERTQAWLDAALASTS
jgi:hypothetical protein